MKTKIATLAANQQVTGLFGLRDLTVRTSKAGRDYLELALCDSSGKIKGYLLDDVAEALESLEADSVVQVHAVIHLYNGVLEMKIQTVRPVREEEADIREFAPVVTGGVAPWKVKLLAILGLIRNSNCRRIVDAFTSDEVFMDRFVHAPAGLIEHHNYVGGLLEHTVNVMRHAAFLSKGNEALINRDLLLTGCFLHDIGKTKEIDGMLTLKYTMPGRLLGHTVLGASMLEERIKRIGPYPADLAMLFKHMILYHHVEAGVGSLVVPCTPEAITLHEADSTDAKINHLYCHLGESEENRLWSHYDGFLKTEILQRNSFGASLPYKSEAA